LFPTAEDDLTEAMPRLQSRLEVCADDVRKEPEDFKHVRLASTVGANEHVQIA
jgi:hypothetical protein